MTVFQWIVAPLLGLLFLRECATFGRRTRGRTFAVLRAGVLLSGTIAVLAPDLTQRAAQALGVGRGADVLLYGLCLTFLATTWWFYAETQRLRRDLTVLVRQEAIDRAVRRPPANDDERASD